VRELVLAQCAVMLLLGGLAPTVAAGRRAAEAALVAGLGADKLVAMAELQASVLCSLATAFTMLRS
jgi:hypothetical protein